MNYKIDKTDDGRFKLTVELLGEGKSVDFNKVNFSLDKQEGLIHVRSHSTWIDMDRARIESDIQRGVSTFQYLQNWSAEFAELVKDISPRFSLVNDYGNGIVELAFLENGKTVLV